MESVVNQTLIFMQSKLHTFRVISGSSIFYEHNKARYFTFSGNYLREMKYGWVRK